MSRGSSKRAAPRRSGPPGLAARRAAVGLLAQVLEDGAMLDERGLGALSSSERAEAHGIAATALRRLGQIDALLQVFVTREPRPAVLQILRAMAAEIVFQGTAPHAAVDLAVRLAKERRDSQRAAGLINAVGRRLAADGAEITADQDAAELNTPEWLAQRLVEDWGPAIAGAVAAAHIDGAYHDLTMRTPGDAKAFAREIDGRLLPNGSVRWQGRGQLTALPGFAEGAWWAQDAAAAMPAALIPTTAGKRVLDLCAAPGGKTMQLVAGGAQVTALDISADRMKRLEENLSRTGLSADCVTGDALAWTPEAPFDAVLLDAPCSATGTIRRHPDLPHRRRPDLKALTALQSQLLDRAWGWLAPGGVLVYATCSLLRAEGEAQADAVLARHPDARRTPIEAPWADGLTTAQGDLRTRPDHWRERGGLDGFFATRLAKT
ncbi:MAG: transcription antitermination factor NusB [Pseudomonadota bacterium]